MLCSRSLRRAGFVDQISDQPPSGIRSRPDLWESCNRPLQLIRPRARAIRFARVEVPPSPVFPQAEAAAEETCEPCGRRRASAGGGDRTGVHPRPTTALVPFAAGGLQFELGAKAAASNRSKLPRRLNGQPVVPERELLDLERPRAGSNACSPARKAPYWKVLIRKAERGHYELNLSVPAERPPASGAHVGSVVASSDAAQHLVNNRRLHAPSSRLKTETKRASTAGQHRVTDKSGASRQAFSRAASRSARRRNA
jgi:hypothetical protein